MSKSRTLAMFFLTVSLFVSTLEAQDWTRFRGPNGSGLGSSSSPLPVEWSEDKNTKWSIDLPGPGHSSPIIVGDKIFLTCWTGYGVDGGSKRQEDLRLHLLCFNREDGETLWNKVIEPSLPEENYGNMFAEHGYATHTPVSDGEHVWAYFGKSGAVCFDMEGNEVWRKNLGSDLHSKRWGSATSPILYGDLVIYTASIESATIFGLNKLTGEEVWKQPADSLAESWSTPVLVPVSEERTDLVVAVPNEMWGLNPETGKFLWWSETPSGSACSSVIENDGVAYYVDSGRRGGGAMAIKVGGEGAKDVTANTIWKTGERSRIGTPIFFEDRLYWISGGIATAVRADTGEKIYNERLKKPKSAPGGRQGIRGMEYSSPVAVDGKIYYVTRSGVAYVLQMGDEFKQLAANTFTDGGDFSASPAISDGQLFIRSTKKLYCIQAESEAE